MSAPGEPFPATRWESDDHSDFGRRFAGLVEDGSDLDGEARLADVLAPRRARVLDAGSGMGRVAQGLLRRGHDVTAVEKDPALVAQSRATYPDVVVVESDLLGVTPDLLAAHGRPTSYDLVVVVGNVMVLLAPDTERTVLTGLAALLEPRGRMLVGFKLVGGPLNASTYPEADFRADAAAAGLVVQHRLGGYDLTAADPDYAVFVLAPGL